MKLETIILLVLLYFCQTNAYIDRSSSNSREYQIQSADLHRREVRHAERLKEFRFKRVDDKSDDERRLFSQETSRNSDFADNVDRNNNIIRRQRILPYHTYRSGDGRISEGSDLIFSQRNNFCTKSVDRRSDGFSKAICSKRRTDDVSRRIENLETYNRGFPENRNLYKSERSTELRRKREVQIPDVSSTQRRILGSRIDRIDRAHRSSEPRRISNVNHVNNLKISKDNTVQGNTANIRVHNEDQSRINNQLSSENRNRFTVKHSNLQRLEENVREVNANSIQRRTTSEFSVDRNKMPSTSDNIENRLTQREGRNSFNLRQISERRNEIFRDVHSVPVLTSRISSTTFSPMTDRCSLRNQNAFNLERICERRQERNIRDIYFDSSRRIISNSRLSDNKRPQFFDRKDRCSSEFTTTRFSNLVRLTEDREDNVRSHMVTTFSPINDRRSRNSIDGERFNKQREERSEKEIASKLLQSRISETSDRRLIDRRDFDYETRNIRRSNPRLNQHKLETKTNGIERSSFQLNNRRLLKTRSNNNLQFFNERRERNVRQTELRRNHRFSTDDEIRHDERSSMSEIMNRRSSKNGNNLIQRRISKSNTIRTYRSPISNGIEHTPLTNKNTEQKTFKFTSNRERSIHENIRVSREQFNRNIRQRHSSTLDYNGSVEYRMESRRANFEKREDAKSVAEKQLQSTQPSQNRVHTDQQRTQRVDFKNIQRESPQELKSYHPLKRMSNIEFRRKSVNVNEDNKDNRPYLERTEIKIIRDRNYRSVSPTIQIRHENMQTKMVQSITSADRAVFRQVAYQSLNELQQNDRKDTQNRNGNSIMNNENASEKRRRDIRIENRRSYILVDNINKKSSYEYSSAWLSMAKLLLLSITVAQILSASNPKLFRFNKVMPLFTYHKEKVF